VESTCFDDIDANILGASINLLLHEIGRCFVNTKYSLGVLCSEGSRRGHGITAVSSDHFLISLEASAQITLATKQTEYSNRHGLRSARTIRARDHQYALHQAEVRSMQFDMC